MYTIDGNYKLSETESAIQAKEAAGRKLKSLASDSATPPANAAEFDNLPAGQRPTPFHLIRILPPGAVEVWNGKIYVEGNLQQAFGYRE